MRTKTLLLSAAVIAAGIATSVAQSVYSVNAVGYVNVTLLSGYNLIANPLNGTNNNLNTIIPAAPEGSAVLRWNAASQGFNPSGDSYLGGVWLDGSFNPTATTINPGEAFFFQNNSGANATITFVGEVPQGNLVNPVPSNYGFISSIVPQSAGLPALSFPGQEGMAFLKWDAVDQGYCCGHSFLGGAWFDGSFNQVDPVPGVAEGFVINNPGAPVNWTRTFSVNN